MPHKRAKRSVREKDRSQSGLNLPPGALHAIDHEEMPKGAARILNAAKVQAEYRMKRKRTPDEGAADSGSIPRKKRKSAAEDARGQTMKIQPGESMTHFNRRVEDSMRGVLREAMKSSSAHARRAKKERVSEKSSQSNAKSIAATPQSKKSEITMSESDNKPKSPALKETKAAQKSKLTEFAHLSTSTPKRLNDIVQAPPELKKLPRGAKPRLSATSGITLAQGAISMAQKAMLEEERERVVKLYREMKKAKAGV
ncbi:uncharacterized protein FIBRA_04228 [Fibroporia radiculosa]|uniref:Uncharacterized protein n=1 Tax=Fibroporia radiculosa TaxID=599839 RepID=J4GNZ8_9APHY|nr:uncharacterized protein FIBRA_04228 [Fibroporia radiculosa]CCM02150.1 predicted protein [Fibroporia radiculosa]